MRKMFIALSLLFSLTITSANAVEVTQEAKITGLYVAFFNRAADQAGLEYWTTTAGNVANEGGDISSVFKTLSKGFATHPTFKSTYDDLTDEEFVKAIYRNALGRDGDAEGIAYWTDLIDRGMIRSDMVATFVELSMVTDLTPANYPTLSSAELAAAQLRQDLITNKVTVSLAFTNQLGTLSNVVDSDNPEEDRAYLASIKIITEVTEDPETVSGILDCLDSIKESNDPIRDILGKCTATPNIVPTADAGEDTTVEVDTAVTITGVGTDSDGVIVEYEWKEGTDVLATTASFDYISTTVETHTLTLTVTDDDGDTAQDLVLVNVINLPVNNLPLVEADIDTIMLVNNTAIITGTASDSDGIIVSIEWSENGNFLADTLSFDYTPTTTGNHTLTLTVMDDDGASNSDTMVVTVNNPPAVNNPPTANAGEDKAVEVDTTVTITGSGADTDGSIVEYEWKEGTIFLATTATFDYIPTTVGLHTLILTVTDDDGAMVSDEMNVTATATPNQLPTANAGDDKSVEVDTTVTITGSGKDSDGVIVEYEWKEGTRFLATTATFDYIPTTVGVHTLTLTVTDDDGAMVSDDMNVTATPLSVDTEAPQLTSTSGSDNNHGVDNTITVDYSAIVSDNVTSDANMAIVITSSNLELTITNAGTSVTFTRTDGAAGDSTVILKFVDEAGNQSVVFTQTVFDLMDI